MNYTQDFLYEEMLTAKKVWDGIDEGFLNSISKAINFVVECLKKDGSIFLMGNGGSAADAQHWAGELVGRFLLERKPLRAIALTTNSSVLTALVNDYPPEKVFSRQIEALVRPGDVVIAISTSGNSKNIIEGSLVAKKFGCIVIGFTGNSDSLLSQFCDVCVQAPSNETPRIQEVHLLGGHLLCAGVERLMFLGD